MSTESVRVVVKCRPMSAKEKDGLCQQVVEIDNKTSLCRIRNPSDASDAPSKVFTFDGAYGEETTNATVYADVVFPLVEAVTEGYNGTVFAYGQTGCGKTFSMQGIVNSAAQQGLIPRAFEQIFDTIAVSESTRYLIHASCLEIYNEDIRDLLAKDTKTKLELKEKPDGTVFVKDLTMHPCGNVRDCERVMKSGWSRRAVGATHMNSVSSRSHSIFTIHLERYDVSGEGDTGKIRASKLNLVDLAGSERQGKTGSTGERFKEATKINLSLSALGNVISALVDGKSNHIPYRDSKLTRLLQDSLGGNTKTLMVACLSPADTNYEETISTLRYASRAKRIRNKPRINEDPKDALIREYLEEIAKLKAMLQETTKQEQGGQSLPQLPCMDQSVVQNLEEDEDEKKLTDVTQEYREKMEQIIGELEEAKANRDRAASEIEQLRLERQAEIETLKEQHLRDEKKMLDELEEARKGRAALTDEVIVLKAKYGEEVKNRQRCVSPERMEAEKTRIREEYEQHMKRVTEELELVKKNRDDLQVQMEDLNKSYAVELEKFPVVVLTEQATQEKIRVQQEYEQKILSINTQLTQAQCTNEYVTSEMARLRQQYANNILELSASKSATVGVASCAEGVGESLNNNSAETGPDVSNQEKKPPSHAAAQSEKVQNLNKPTIKMTAKQFEREKKNVYQEYEARTAVLEKQTEKLRKARDDIAKEISRIRLRYHQAVDNCGNDPATKNPEIAKRKVKARFELLMDHVRSELFVLKKSKDFITEELTRNRIAKETFDQKLDKITEDLKQEKTNKDKANSDSVVLLETLLEEFRDINRNLSQQKLEFVKERDEMEGKALEEKMKSGVMSKEEVSTRRSLANERTKRWIEMTGNNQILRICDDNLNGREKRTAPETTGMNCGDKPASGTPMTTEPGSESSVHPEGVPLARNNEHGLVSDSLTLVKDLMQVKRATDEAAVASRSPSMSPEQLQARSDAERRLRELREQMIEGGYGAANKTAIIEKLRKKKKHAEERLRRRRVDTDLGDSEAPPDPKSAVVFRNAEEELASKKNTIEYLLSQNSMLRKEIRDIQCEFEFDRMDYLDTIRTQEKSLLWYQAFVQKVLPMLRRNANYVDVEKIQAQSEWNDLNRRWKLPKFIIERFTLPPAVGTGGVGRGVPAAGTGRGRSESEVGEEGGVEPEGAGAWIPDEGCIQDPQFSDCVAAVRLLGEDDEEDDDDDGRLCPEDKYIQHLRENAMSDPGANYFKQKNSGVRGGAARVGSGSGGKGLTDELLRNANYTAFNQRFSTEKNLAKPKIPLTVVSGEDKHP